MTERAETVADFLKSPSGCVLVSVDKAKGSTPRDAGAFMLVSKTAIFRTIGGGQLEYMAIDNARRMLRTDLAEDHADIGLGPEIGQCCGGRVSLRFQRVYESLSSQIIQAIEDESASQPHVYIFGAGHVGNALARVFNLLPLRAILVDTRKTELDTAPDGTETMLLAMPETIVRDAPKGSAFLVLTHDHALDFLIVKEALARDDAGYIGMIGSKSKRGTFSHWFKREGGAEGELHRLICPMGGNAVKDKRPEVIASLVAAEVITALLGQDQKAMIAA